MRIVYHQAKSGKMVHAEEASRPELHNFKIQVYLSHRWADWSGYRTLLECEEQFDELEHNANRLKNPAEYRVVEDIA